MTQFQDAAGLATSRGVIRREKPRGPGEDPGATIGILLSEAVSPGVENASPLAGMTVEWAMCQNGILEFTNEPDH